jgi:hypothetical protein
VGVGVDDGDGVGDGVGVGVGITTRCSIVSDPLTPASKATVQNTRGENGSFTQA